jgi:hypothetical protein
MSQAGRGCGVSSATHWPKRATSARLRYSHLATRFLPNYSKRRHNPVPHA